MVYSRCVSDSVVKVNNVDNVNNAVVFSKSSSYGGKSWLTRETRLSGENELFSLAASPRSMGMGMVARSTPQCFYPSIHSQMGSQGKACLERAIHLKV